jgi:pimeloyl-ACP methyl ester carboxylesterase
MVMTTTGVETVILERDDLDFTAYAAGCGPLVLCVHGFPDSANTFQHQFPALVAAGYRVVAPTIRGYEPSSQPKNGDYQIEELAGDVIAWIDHLGEEKVHLVGHDWGAVMAYVACARAPARFHSLTTLGIPHPARFTRAGIRKLPTQLLKSWYMLFFQLPALPEYAIQWSDWFLLRHLWSSWSPGSGLPTGDWRALRETFGAPGVRAAMLSYYRQNVSPAVLLGLARSPITSLREVPVRTLAVSGADDGCMDARLYDYTMLERDFPAGLRIERVEAAGHWAHMERADEVNRLILEWISTAQAGLHAGL